jgi:hypothetical protein
MVQDCHGIFCQMALTTDIILLNTKIKILKVIGFAFFFFKMASKLLLEVGPGRFKHLDSV